MATIGRALWVGCYKDVNVTGPGNCLMAEPVGLVRKRDGALIARPSDAEGTTWTTPWGETWRGVEAYLDPPGPATAAEAQQALRARVAALMAPLGSQPVVLIAQAYDRNGAWSDMTTLLALQDVYPELVQTYSNVVALLAFAKGRRGGLDSHPELAAAWQRIAAGVTEPTLPAATPTAAGVPGIDVLSYGSSLSAGGTWAVQVRLRHDGTRVGVHLDKGALWVEATNSAGSDHTVKPRPVAIL